jgi:hypothetical protein
MNQNKRTIEMKRLTALFGLLAFSPMMAMPAVGADYDLVIRACPKTANFE